MKKLLFSLVLFCAVFTAAQTTIQTSGNSSNSAVPPAYVTPDCTLSGTLTATGTSPVLANSDTGCSTWNIVYSANSVTSVISIEVDFASEGAALGTPGSFTVWPAAQVGNGTLPLTTITENAATLSGYHPYVQVKLITLTGAGAQVKYKLYGWKGQGSSDVVNSAAGVSQSVLAGSAQADTQSNSLNLFTGQAGSVVSERAFPFVFNGTTWDRVRSGGATGFLGITGAGANGAAVSGNPVLLAGSDGTTIRTLLTNSDGTLVVSGQSTKTTYSISTIVAPGAAATDIFGVCGSGTKTVRITLFSVSGVATAASAQIFRIIKRSAADTAGTPQSVTIVPNDSANAAATATSTAYTANPTPGATVGDVRNFTATLTTAAGAIPAVFYSIPFGVENDQEVVLRGTAQCLYVNQNGTTPTGESITVSMQFTEE